ncbi:MAG: UxaA family hydrolase [Phycisphaerales bacterium]
MTEVTGYRRPDGSVGTRNLVLNVPVVVCSTLVSAEVARQTGAVTLTHQHGCGHIGDDVDHTEVTYVALATHPNVAESIVFSLGCETLQGPRVERRIAERGGTTQLVGIQSSGGAEPATRAGLAVVTEAVARSRSERESVQASDISIGFVLQRHSDTCLDLISKARTAGMRVIIAGVSEFVSEALAMLGGSVADLEYAERADAPVSVWPAEERGSAGALTVAIAGAQVLVVAPEANQLPTGVPVAPVVVVGASSGLHALIHDDIDLTEGADADEAWGRLLEIVNGSPSKLESRANGDVVIPRLRRTM